MIKHWIVFLAVLLFAWPSSAQYENVWVFGRSGSGLNFNENLPVSIGTSIAGFGEANASICDGHGRLLFYSEGSKVWDSEHKIMPNGDNLTPIPNAGGYSATSSTAQGCMIIPVPKNPGRYYVLSLTSIDNVNPENGGRLYYSEIDISLNFGRGDIIPNRKRILIDTNLTEAMTAVPGNQCNIWLITYSRAIPYSFKVYEVTGAGISNDPVVSLTGLPLTGSHAFTASVSPNRKKLFAGQLLCDLDPQDGKVGNCFTLKTDWYGWYGSCFSPDNSKLYVASIVFGGMENSIYQYDLSTGDPTTIVNSAQLIGNCAPTQLKLGPDGRIYFFADWSNVSLRMASIASPNLRGAASQYNLNNTIPLYGTGRLGLPNIVPAELVPSDTLSRVFTKVALCFDSVLELAIDVQAHHIQWEDGSIGLTRKVTASGSYIVHYQVGNHSCTINVDTFHVQFPASLPNITILPECRGDRNGKAYAASYAEDSILYSYTWLHEETLDTLSISDTLMNAPSGPYRLYIHTSSGCDTVLFFELPEEDRRVSFDVDSLICLGDTVSLNNTSSLHFKEYYWDFGDGTNAYIASPEHVYLKHGTYSIRLIGKGSVCRDTTYRFITVDRPVPYISFTKDRDSSCIGEAVFFYHQRYTSTTMLQWDFGSESILSMLEDAFSYAFDQPGKIPLTLTVNFRACPSIQFMDTLYVIPFPFVYLGADNVLCMHGQSIILSNQVEAQAGVRYLWSNGAQEESIAVTHPGRYSLTVSNQQGCSITETVTVIKNCHLLPPNAFTPNGDGVNDYFFPRQFLSSGVTTIHFQIFNRWGQLLFASNNPEGRGWDGRFNAIMQLAGVYVYKVSLRFDNGQEETYHGNVTLIR